MDVKEGIVDEKIGNRATPQSDEAPQNPEFLQLCEKVRKESREREAQKLESGGLGHNLDYQICTSTSIATSRYGGKILTPGMWRSCYDIFLCGRLGLYCYNFEKVTNYEFRFVREYSHDYGNHGSLFIVLEAMNPADNSQFVMKTRVRHNNNLAAGLWETCFYLEEDSQEKDHEWDNESIDDDYEDGEEDDESEDEKWYKAEDEKWDNEAIDDQYKGEMPKWLSDVDKQHCYVVGESELKDPDNDWLELFAEFAYFSLYKGQCESFEIAECLPLVIEEVIVETRGETETELSEKLKAANAIFYISFGCRDDPLEGNHVHYRAVVRKTVDGKPGHARLEVTCSIVGSGASNEANKEEREQT